MQILGRRLVVLCFGLWAATAACLARDFAFFEPVQPPRPLQIMVHRGEARQAPENSRPALARCIEDGLEWAEVDVRRTRDGQHVIAHGATLAASNGVWRVDERTLEEFQSLDIGSAFAVRYVGVRPLSLKECLKLAKGKLNLYLDCKAVDPDQLAREILEAAMERQVVVYDELDHLHRLRVAADGKLALMAKWHPELGTTDWAVTNGLAAVEIDAPELTAAICEAFHRQGIKVEAKTLDLWDQPEFWSKAAAGGVDWIQTDLPEELMAYWLWQRIPTRPVRFSLHRGANRYAPENTLPAFEKGIRLGADFVEFDVRTTSDGKFYLLHDSQLDGKTDGKGKIAELPSSVVSTLSAGVKFGRDYAKVPLPTLEEFLNDVAGKVGLYFDAKDIAPEALSDALERHQAVERTVVYGGPGFLAKVKAAKPRIRLLAPLESPSALEALARDLKPFAVDADWEILSPELIARCHELGIQVFSDALGNHESIEEYQKAMDWGIDLIQTDHPLRLFRAIERRAALKAPAPGGSLVDKVNPMIGASTSAEYGEGKTFPGAATPFGLVQLSPDTITGGDNGPGYSYEHKSIEGFSFTHMSGIGWYGDLGNFLVMPTTGPLKTGRGVLGAEDGYRSRFRHETEIAQAGYYAVTLDDYHIRAEATVAPHAGMLRFTFPKAERARLQIDLSRRVGGTSTRQRVKVVDDQTIEGWMKCPPAGGGWGNGGGKANYTVYFHARFSQPITRCGVWSAEIPAGWSRKREDIESERYRKVVDAARVLPGCRELEGDHLGFYTEFPTTDGEQVLLKAGISFVSLEGARQNLERDIAGWDFDALRAGARSLWEQAFAGVAIRGGSDAQREAFATALYHTMLDPRAYSDVDGNYTGADGKAHQAQNFTYRTIFSGWDVYRSQYPLLTIIRPDVVNDTVNSLMQQAELSGNGYLARWEMMTTESGCMIGDPAVSVFTEAYLKGIRGYDAAHAYALCRQSVELTNDNGNQRVEYRRLGYAPGSISVTLENAYFDYCAGRFAEALGRANDAARLLPRALNYRHLYDRSVENMRAKNADGAWTAWQGATQGGQGCVESNPYQQGWFAPQDTAGLIDLMGPDYFVRYLTEFFEKTPLTFKWNDYCNHSNEPVHHTAYLFAYAGRPWLSQKWARIIMDHAYGAGVKGLCGNEDVGQMSAWYILSAVGFHPVSPVDGLYVIGSPLFDEATLRLDPRYYPGGAFTVRTRNNSARHPYVQSATLNGKPLNRAWIRHAEVAAGGTLELVMGPDPNTAWGSAADQLPPRNFNPAP